jgi:hypothetical protein
MFSRISNRISNPVDQESVRASLLKLGSEHNLDSARLQSCSAESTCADNSADNGNKRCMPKEFPVCKTKTDVIFPTNVTAPNDQGDETLYLISQSNTAWQPILTTECCPDAMVAYPFSCVTVFTYKKSITTAGNWPHILSQCKIFLLFLFTDSVPVIC